MLLSLFRHRCAADVSGRVSVFVGLVAALWLACPACVFGQVTFTSQATASYTLDGRTLQSGYTEVRYYDTKSLATQNPLSEPVRLAGSVGGSLGSGRAGSSVFANATAEGGAGLMRVSINGSSSAAWTSASRASVGSLTNGIVTVGWRDAYLLTGNPANPQPGRTLLIQAFLNVSGSMTGEVTPPLFNAAFNPGISNMLTSLSLTGQDQLGRNVIAMVPPYNNLWAVEEQSTARSGFTPRHGTAPTTIPLLLTVQEGQLASFIFQMTLRGQVSSSYGSNFFGTDSTKASFDADYSHTVSWGGITGVTDAATGLPVTGWSISSASGADYANPIPEPGTLLLCVGVSFGMLHRRARGPAGHEVRPRAWGEALSGCLKPRMGPE